MATRSLETPVGRLTLTEHALHLTSARWGGAGEDRSPLLLEACDQIAAYFAGEREVFDLACAVEGSATQRAICAAIAAIPFGETRSYGALARELGLSAQAVGQGCGANPLPILIPCHRVVGARDLGGFSGGTGIDTKVALLRHEGAASLLI